MTTYEWDTSCADLELDRLALGWTGEDQVAFAGVLAAGYTRVKADIHVETGRLSNSAHAFVENSDNDYWSAEISVGGPGIRYAASEFFGYSPRHGGYPSHQYFKTVGWLPLPRGADAEWTQGPVRDAGSAGRGSNPIDEDMVKQALQFFQRGKKTPHPEGNRRWS